VAVVYMLLQYTAFSWHLTTLHYLWHPTLASLSSVFLCYLPRSSLTIYYWLAPTNCTGAHNTSAMYR